MMNVVLYHYCNRFEAFFLTSGSEAETHSADLMLLHCTLREKCLRNGSRRGPPHVEITSHSERHLGCAFQAFSRNSSNTKPASALLAFISPAQRRQRDRCIIRNTDYFSPDFSSPPLKSPPAFWISRYLVTVAVFGAAPVCKTSSRSYM